MEDPAPGEVSDLMVHTYRLVIAFLILAWIFILLRVYTRTVIISNFGWDDTAMVLVGVSTASDLLILCPNLSRRYSLFTVEQSSTSTTMVAVLL